MPYIDPGTGSFVVQAIVATLAGIGVAVGTYRRKLWSYFTGSKSEPEASERDGPTGRAAGDD